MSPWNAFETKARTTDPAKSWLNNSHTPENTNNCAKKARTHRQQQDATKQAQIIYSEKSKETTSLDATKQAQNYSEKGPKVKKRKKLWLKGSQVANDLPQLGVASAKAIRVVHTLTKAKNAALEGGENEISPLSISERLHKNSSQDQ